MNKVLIDIETNSLYKPSKVWLIVTKDINTNELKIFRDPIDTNSFLEYAKTIDFWVGHNFLEFDYPILNQLLGLEVNDIAGHCHDTLILSRLFNYSRPGGHSIEQYGIEFGLPKGGHRDFTKYSMELEEYCIRDVEILSRVYGGMLGRVSDPHWADAIRLEHDFQLIVNQLHHNGFSFNIHRAERLLETVTQRLSVLDKDIEAAFPPKLKLIREIHPKETKHGTLSRTDFRWVVDGDLSIFNGGPFCRCSWESFNPSSHKQLIDVLSQAGWSPIDRTTTHIETERELARQRYSREKDADRVQHLKDKLVNLKKYGWKINENNLSTLPDTAPAPARSLAHRILLEARRRTLTEWLSLVQDDGRIHGKFVGIGAWTHRMAHQNPNTANIPSEFKEDGSVKLLGKEMRSLWQAPRNRLLVGVDAEGIQLRVFAHYIDDKELTDAILSGKKSKKTDPHSLNQRILGSVCKSRQAAKRFLYALFLGAGLGKLSQILGCDEPETQEALDRLMEQYTGWARLKREVIPRDAQRGYFIGLDGRKVALPGTTTGERKHLAMSGYLQNGEAIIMKKAAIKWNQQLTKEDLGRILFVNMVHDEWQTEVGNSMDKAIKIAKIQAESLKLVGEELGLKCPLAGSYWNEDHNDYTIGTNWYQTH